MNKIKTGNKAGLFLVGLTIFLDSVLYGFLTYLIGILIDLGTQQKLSEMIELTKIMIVLAVVLLFTGLLLSVIQSRWISVTMTELKRDYINQVLNQDIIDVQKDRIPQMYSNLTNDFDRYETKYIEKIPEVISMVAQFLIAVVLIGTVSPGLMVVPFIMMVLLWNSSKKNSKPIKEKEEEKTESLVKYTSFINETVQGYEVIKQHQLEEDREDQFMKNAVQVQNDNYQVDVQSTKVDAKNSLLINGLFMALIIIGMVAASRSGISLGGVVVIFSAFSSVTWPLQQLSLTIAEMGGISDIIMKFDIKSKPSSRDIEVKDFETLTFAENDLGYEDEVILKNVNLQLQRGEKVLIIGPSGAGKSTILKTLRQTIKPCTGVVSLNGHDISKIKAGDYFSLFATVDQTGFIFSGKLQDNITLYQDVSDERVMEVMKKVGLEDLDLDSEILNDGDNISGGQRARVLLARALCLDAQIIVCDEIFASLDSDVARSIEAGLLSLDVTSLNVSHIYFEENIPKYSRIYIVEDNTIKIAETIREVQERMLEFSEYPDAP